MKNKERQHKEYLRTTIELAVGIFRDFKEEAIDSAMLAKMCNTIVEAADLVASSDEEFAKSWCSFRNAPPLYDNTEEVMEKLDNVLKVDSKLMSHLKVDEDDCENVVSDMSCGSINRSTNEIELECDNCGSKMKLCDRDIEVGVNGGLFNRKKVYRNTYKCCDCGTREGYVDFNQKEENLCGFEAFHHTLLKCVQKNHKPSKH